jgi:cyanophycinase
MKSIRWFSALVILFTLLLAPVATHAAPATGYEYYVSGNPEDVVTTAMPGFLLAGGGTDQDDAMRWLIQQSGGGDFVVIRASGTDAYNPYLYNDLGGIDSAETLIITQSRGAFDPFVFDKILSAEALFLAGGNQWDYVRYWKNTPIEDAIHTLVARGTPIGGTSAGLAVLGEFAFSAEKGTILSNEALKNPYHPRLTLSRDFLHLPNLETTITDSHFVTRERMGRLVTFLARILADGWADTARGIAVNERTALAVDANGWAQVFGEGPVYFLETTRQPEVVKKSTPLTFRDIAVYRISGPEARFNLRLWLGQGGTAYSLSAIEGVLSTTQANGEIY